MATERDYIKEIPSIRGMFTALPSDKIPDGFAANSINIDYSTGGVIAPMKGFSLVGNSQGVTGKVFGIFGYSKNDNNELLVAVFDDGSTGTLMWLNEVRSRWETLVASLTTGYRMGFAAFNGTGTNSLIFCNTQQNFSTWTGAVAYYASDNGSNTITVTVDSPATTLATAGFSASGSLIIGGTTITYTGISSLTFTGCSAVPSSPTVGDGIAQLPDTTTHSALPKNNIFLVADGRLWAAGNPSAVNRLYYSQVGVATNFTAATAPDDPGFEDFPDGKGPIKSLGAKDGYVMILKKDLVRAYKLDYPSSTTRTPVRKTLFSAEDIGGSSVFGIAGIYNDLVYTTTLGAIRRLYVPDANESYKTDDWTQKIQPTVRALNWDESVTVFWPKERILLSAGRSEDSDNNDKVISIQFHEDEEDRTLIDIGTMDWPINCATIFRGDLYFGCSIASKVYKAFDGYEKDGGPYRAIYTTKQYDFLQTFLEKMNLLIPAFGRIGSGTTINFELLLDGGTRGVFNATLSSTDTGYIFQEAINTIGAFEIGVEPIGGTIEDANDLDKFRVFFNTSNNYTMYNIQLTIYSSGKGQRWLMSDLGYAVVDAHYTVPKNLKKAFNLNES